VKGKEKKKKHKKKTVKKNHFEMRAKLTFAASHAARFPRGDDDTSLESLLHTVVKQCQCGYASE
jgi:hypothetical protein